MNAVGTKWHTSSLHSQNLPYVRAALAFDAITNGTSFARQLVKSRQVELMGGRVLATIRATAEASRHWKAMGYGVGYELVEGLRSRVTGSLDMVAFNHFLHLHKRR